MITLLFQLIHIPYYSCFDWYALTAQALCWSLYPRLTNHWFTRLMLFGLRQAVMSGSDVIAYKAGLYLVLDDIYTTWQHSLLEVRYPDGTQDFRPSRSDFLRKTNQSIELENRQNLTKQNNPSKKINERTNKQKHKAHCEDSVAPEKTLVCEKRKEEANGIWVVSSALIGAKILKHWDWHTSLRLVAYKFDVSEKFLIDIVKEQSLWVGWQQMMVRKSLFCAWIKRPNRPTCGTFCWIRLDQLADNLQAEGGGGETQKEEQGTSVPESGA